MAGKDLPHIVLALEIFLACVSQRLTGVIEATCRNPEIGVVCECVLLIDEMNIVCRNHLDSKFAA